jgi:hypothetical protein
MAYTVGATVGADRLPCTPRLCARPFTTATHSTRHTQQPPKPAIANHSHRYSYNDLVLPLTAGDGIRWRR